MSQAFLTSLRARYDAAVAEIDEIQNKAAAENRDLTEDELKTVEARSAEATAFVPRIKTVADQLERNAQVDAMAARVAVDQSEGATPSQDAERVTGSGEHARANGVGEQTRGERMAAPARTQDRDPGHYRRGGDHSFFADMYRSAEKLDDGEARQRLHEHARALTTTGEGPGLVPPVWLVEEYETKARFGRALANAVRNLPLSNPSPITLPGQTAGTDSVVAEQSAENDAVASTDAYDSGTVTVTPKPTAGSQIFSRQMFDMSNPAIDELVYGDLLAVYDDKVEAKVCAAVVAAAGSAVTTFATNAAFAGTAPATPGLDALVDAAIAVRNARKLPANAHVMGVARWGILKKLKDTTGRPLLPNAQHGPMNVQGLGTIMADGEHEGIPIIVSDGISTGSFPETIATLRLQDTILWEGSMMRFRFEEVSGPQSIKVGIWAYTACVVRQAAHSVRKTVITAAS